MRSYKRSRLSPDSVKNGNRVKIDENKAVPAVARSDYLLNDCAAAFLILFYLSFNHLKNLLNVFRTVPQRAHDDVTEVSFTRLNKNLSWFIEA